MLPKQAIAFPEVAIIRKGTPKQNYNGKQIQGKDLGRAFRIAFAPGTDTARAAFLSTYKDARVVKYGDGFVEPEGIQIERLRCMVTTRSASDAFEWANEAYQFGRLVAKADDEHFITQRNPATGEYIIENGEPYTVFKHGMSIDYMGKDNQAKSLPIKTHGRLKLFLPELGQLVHFTLKTTSYYDRLSIQGQLAGIQFFADTLNNGNAAGIPFWVYRMQKERIWNKPNGQPQPIKLWEIVIEADSDWVRSATQRLGAFALGGVAPLALPEVITDPSIFDGEDEAPDVSNAIDATSAEVTEPPVKIEPLPRSVPADNVQLKKQHSQLWSQASRAGLINKEAVEVWSIRANDGAEAIQAKSVLIKDALEKLSKETKEKIGFGKETLEELPI